MKKILLAILIFSGLVSCTDNQRARAFGSTEIVYLNANEKFINISWRQDDLWIVVKDTITGEIYAREKSSFGIF